MCTVWGVVQNKSVEPSIFLKTIYFVSPYHESQLSSMAKLLIANEVRIGGLGGGRLQTSTFHAFPHLIRVASVVDFAAYVPGGNWVTVGFDPPWSVL